MPTSPPSLDFSRRSFLRLAAAALGLSCSGWFRAMADDLAGHPQRRRSCILLWMNGGPSQTDTFDMKPSHENGGSFRPIETSVPGIQICEHLPRVAALAEHLGIVRSMSTPEGDHARATYHLRTGYQQSGPIRYPTLGSLLSKELGSDEAELPNFVAIAPFRVFNPAAYGPGFLGPRYAPLTVGDTVSYTQLQQPNTDAQLGVDDLAPPPGVSQQEMDARLDILRALQQGFLERHHTLTVESHDTVYRRAVRMINSPAARAFQLDEEPGDVRDAYGRNRFGQACLMARRLVERGVPFVEVTLGNFAAANQSWDTHAQNFPAVQALCETLDPAWSQLIIDLRHRGLLETTLILWMGEFGRTPRINQAAGRDHYPAAWSVVLAGGGIRGGQAVGRTSPDGMSVEDRPVSVPDLLATVCSALGVDPMAQNLSDLGRPIRIVDREHTLISELLA